MAIVSTMQRVSRYFPKNTTFNLIFDYLNRCLLENSTENLRISSLPLGAFEKFNLSDDIFALEQVFITKKREECFIESHKRYIDFQLILSGTEQMEYADINRLTVDSRYDESKDLITYKLTDQTSKILLTKGDIAIFFPEDAHVGLPKYKTKELVRKTVIKLPLEYFQQC